MVVADDARDTCRRFLQFPSGNPVSISADKAGVWTVQLDMAGFVSNQITVTAE